MKHPFNPLALVALTSLAGFLAIPTGNRGLLGFFGFLVFLRYLRVNPDELFLFTLRRAACAAFLVELVCLGPAILVCWLMWPGGNYMASAFGAVTAAAIIFFNLYHTWLEMREMSC